jgi:hypothetical protein
VNDHQGTPSMNLDRLVRLVDEAAKDQLRDELRMLEDRYRQATARADYDELRVLAVQGVEQLRFFVDLMQGYQLVAQLTQRHLHRPGEHVEDGEGSSS